MSRKILVVLGMIVMFVAVPAVAQATTLQAKGSALKAGEEFHATSSNFFLSGMAANYNCKTSQLLGEISKNGGESVSIGLPYVALTDCQFFGIRMDLIGNLPWSIEFQQPDSKGVYIAHLSSESGGLQLQQKLQGLEAECHYHAESVQLEGKEGSSELTIIGKEQFLRESGAASICPEKMTAGGAFALDSKETPITVDMS